MSLERRIAALETHQHLYGEPVYAVMFNPGETRDAARARHGFAPDVPVVFVPEKARVQ